MSRWGSDEPDNYGTFVSYCIPSVVGRRQGIRVKTPFEKMRASEPGPASASGSILYRSGMNKKIGRNFEVFTPCDFIAAITQHIPDKSFQLVRYYGWYSNKMRGRRAKQADEEAQAEGDAVEVIDVSAHEPRRIPSKKWARVGQRGGARAFRHRPAGRNDPRSVARQPLPRLRHRTGRAIRQLKRPAAPECASRTPCSAAPALRRQLCLTSGPTFVTLRP